MINKFLVLIGLFLTTGCASKNIVIDSQNLEIFSANGEYIVRGAISLKRQYQTNEASEAIQWAANQLKNGGVVFLHKGEYLLRKELSIPSYVTIKGSEMGSILTIASEHNSGVAFNIKGKNRVTLKDFVIKSVKNNNSSKTAIVINDSGDCVIDNIYIVGMKENGILFENNTFLSEVKNCRIAACQGSAIKFENLSGGGRGGDFLPNNISNCIIYQGNYGIVCSNAIVVNISDVTVFQSKSNAFYLKNTSNSVLITGCRTYQIQDDAVVVENSHEINISSNIFCWTEGNGIILDGVKWGTVSANNVIDNGSINPYDPQKDAAIATEDFKKVLRSVDHRVSIKSGIVLRNKTKGLSVTGNAIFNWPATPKMKYGISEDETCENNNIISNNINFYSIADVNSMGKGSKVSGNVGSGEVPYTGKIGIPGVQVFNTALVEKFINDIWN
jgi:hypothetical protein